MLVLGSFVRCWWFVLDHDKSLRSVWKTFVVKDGRAGGEAHYLCNGAPTYIGSVKEIGGSCMEDWGNRWEQSCISDQSIEQ